jgi:AbrB family looped-hinge helix DNA binding protein
MRKVVVSSKYQVVIPKEIRDLVGIKAGTLLEIMTYGNRIELVPILPLKKLKGMYKGISTTIERENDRV